MSTPSTPVNPYARYIENRNLVASLAETPARIADAVARMDAVALERSFAPGKWTARQLLIHLADTELMFGGRIRHALTSPDFVVTPFEQDDFLALESSCSAQTALGCYRAVRQFTLELVRTLDEVALARTCRHPEKGTISVRFILEMLAGHERHHLQHFEAIARGAGA